MHTLVDFITHVKGIEYILSVLFIGGFLLFWEILKPRPFATVVSAGKEDLEHLKMNGFRDTMKFAGKIAAAPFIGLMYIVMLPVGFFIVLLSEAVNLLVKGVSTVLGKDVSFEWRPVEAYFTGKKNKQSAANAGKNAKK
ncbi:MAG TPA: hypothetical protein VLN91_08465 [Nitrospirota bacterium]|nr:hypothetical protein [Nitrospirota bacterium]